MPDALEYVPAWHVLHEAESVNPETRYEDHDD